MATADNWEPNNTRLSASDITSFSGAGYADLTISSSTDEDWIKFYLSTNGDETNYISLLNIVGGDLDLQLYNSAGSGIAYSNSTSNSERISLNGLNSGYYYARVYGYQGATGIYRFQLNVTPRVTNDSYEGSSGNNTISTASTLSFSSSAGVINGLNIVSGDIDYYKFTLTAEGSSSNFIGINLTHANGDLDINLYDNSGNEIAHSWTCSDKERINLNGYAAGTYYLMVKGYDGATGNYSIVYNVPDSVAISSDQYESNNTIATATDFSSREDSGTISNLTIQSQDSDYFKFKLHTTGTQNDFLKINFSHSAGDLDIKLYNAAGTLIRSSMSCSNQETISLEGLSSGDYYLQVYGYNNATGNYSLQYSLPTNTDTYEGANGNNTLANANTSFDAGGSGRAMISSATDVDYYRINLGRTGTSADKVKIDFNHNVGDLDLYLYNASGTLMKYSNGVTNSEELSLAGYIAGTYYVKVAGYSGATGSYTLNVTLPSASLTADIYDVSTNNNSFATATNLRSLSGEVTVANNLTIHNASDVDYYKFTLGSAGGSNDKIFINHTHSSGDLDIVLYNSSQNAIKYSLSSTDSETISLEGLAAGDYYLKVYGFMDAVNSYSLGYSVNAANTIAADSYESREPVMIRQSQTINNLSISPATSNVTRADTFSIVLEATGNSTSKIVFSNYRDDWDGLSWQLKNASNTVVASGMGSTISLNGYVAGTYSLVVDAPRSNSYSNYSLTATLPTSSGAPSNSGETSNEKLAVLIYVAADNNLESAALSDLIEMQRANLDAGVEVYVMVDRCNGYATGQGNWTDTRVGKITHNTGSNIVVDWTSWGELNVGSAATLTRFLNWGHSQANADKYAVIMWDHGGAMQGGMSDYASNDDMLSMQEMRNGFMNANASFRSKLEVVGFDACLMGAAEVVEMFNGIADYVVASEESIGNSGWNYTGMLNRLEADMTAAEIASAMVSAGSDSSAVWTLSATRSDGSLTTALNQFGAASSNFTSSDWTKLISAFRSAHSYSYAWMTDLVDVLNRISGASTALTTAVSTLKNALIGTNNSNKIILQNYADGSSHGRGNGIAVVNPIVAGTSVMNYFTNNLSLANTTWGRFLRTLANRSTLEGGTPGTNHSSSTIARQNTFSEVVLSNYITRSTTPCSASDLGVFSGRGMELENLHVSAGDKQYFVFDLGSLNSDFSRLYAMENGDSIVFNVDSDKTLSVRLTDMTGQTVYTTAEGSGMFALDLNVSGLNDSNGWDTNAPVSVVLEVSSTEDTYYNMNFEANWSTGVDYFDYAQGRKNTSRIPEAGNNIIDKATVLAPGEYGGLLSHSGDPDYYFIDAARFDQQVVVTGNDLIVQIVNQNGATLRNAVYANGCYTVEIHDSEYLYVHSTLVITGALGENLSNYSISVGNRTLGTFASTLNTDIKNRGYSQILAWDRNRGAVGMADNQGTTPAPWRGIWDWDDKDAALWRVAGAGHFKGTNVGYAGILLYNGVGNRFAAWTDINTGSYGYVNLCKVEGSFNTRSLADLDGNEYDDILIYDETGSFGVVLDGTTYKDIWHVDKGKFNTWDIIGAGKFDNGMDKLVTENNYNHQIYLWTNNDPTFNTWNWSTKSIGTLAKGDEVVAIGDFQGDGIDDIVVQLADGNMWCWDNGNSQTKRWIGNPGENFTVETVGDYNGDGKEDILLREQASGWGGLGYWGAGYAGNWTDMKTRIETDTRISGSKFDIIA